MGDENCIELRDRSHLCYKSIINYDLDITNILVISPQIRYIEVFDITNPPFNEQIWPVPSDFAKSRFHCTHLYSWLERGTVRAKCLAQEHNTMTPVRARTRTSPPGVSPTLCFRVQLKRFLGCMALIINVSLLLSSISTASSSIFCFKWWTPDHFAQC